jgi:hypothetical protein
MILKSINLLSVLTYTCNRLLSRSNGINNLRICVLCFCIVCSEIAKELAPISL